MSGNEFGGSGRVDAATRTDERLSRLFAEIQNGRPDESPTLDGLVGDGGNTDQRAEELLSTILDTMSVGESFQFDEAVVKQSLDELLVLLIAMRSEKTNGKALMSDLTELFDSHLSPGTVYPSLHDLESDGTLEMFELVRSKEYRVTDHEEAAAIAEAAARQHLALGTFLHAAATEL